MHSGFEFPMQIPQIQKAWYQTKRARYTEALELKYVPVPPPLPGDVLVKVHSVALNHEWKTWPWISWPLRTLPAIPGTECSGWVADANGISDFQKGDEVIGILPLTGKKSHFGSGRGTLAEYVLIPSDMLIKKPKSMPFEQAAGLSGLGVTAYTFLHLMAHVQPGQKIFISGGGTCCGWMLTQLAKAAGVHVTVSCSASKFEQLKSLGADVVLDYKSLPIVDQILALDTQFDAVFDCIGDQSLYQSSPGFLIPSGSYLALSPDLGGITNFWKATQKIASLLWNYWLPVWAGGVPREYRFRSTKITKTEMIKVARLYEDGHIQVLIDSIHTSDKTGVFEAYDRTSSMKANGKVIISMVNF